MQEEGHIAKVCYSSQVSKAPMKSTKTHLVSEECATTVPEEQVDEESYKMCTLRDKSSDPIVVIWLLNGEPTDMEYDTGISLSIISQDTYAKVSKSSCIDDLQKTDVKLKTYMGESIPVLGKVRMHVKREDQEEVLPVLVVKGTGPNLVGRDWLNKIKVNFWEVHSLTNQHPLEELLEKHSVVFKELGCLKGVKAQLLVDGTNPKFHKPRVVPFVFKDKVEADLDRLPSLDIISPVQFSRWAAPIVPVVKQDGSV